jgi:farnesyl-diphosphate farnesyltransferase
MGKITQMLGLLLTHPVEFRTLVQFYIYHETKRDITAQQEHPTSGWDRASMRRCWEFLDITSRSFAAVIKELDGDLARTVGTLLIHVSVQNHQSQLYCTPTRPVHLLKSYD